MKTIVAALALVAVLAGTAQAGELTARVGKPTCEKPRFSFRVESSMNTYQKFTVVLWNAYEGGGEMFLRDRVPAHGGIRGVVNPDWERRSFYVVEVFRSWQWRPWNDEWRNRNWLAGSSARLECA
jgi:hypothetical protein